MFKKIVAFFTPPRRKAVYGLVAAVSVALVAFGIVDQDQINSAVSTVGSVLAAIATIMAFVNTGGTAAQ